VTAEPELDLDRIRAEIDEEVRRKRASGEIPPDLERQLDLVFARFAPVDAVQGDFEAVMVRVEEATKIDLVSPIEAVHPAIAFVKRLVRKAIRWYVRWVAEQVTGLGDALAKAIRILAGRVETIEQSLPTTTSPALLEARAAAPTLDVDHWQEILAPLLARAPGRVAHGECGRGELVARLRSGGLDAYGIEPVQALAQAADDEAIEVRLDEVVDHLAAVPDGALGGLVLSGCVDRLPVPVQLRLADLAAAKLGAGGVLAIVASHPRAWEAGRSSAEADLAPGRPLHPDTWCRLLVTRGFPSPSVHPGPPRADELGQVPADVAGADVLNADIARLNELLFGPASYAVTAERA
jgi:hypothetical protein